MAEMLSLPFSHSVAVPSTPVDSGLMTSDSELSTGRVLTFGRQTILKLIRDDAPECEYDQARGNASRLHGNVKT